MTAEDPYRVLGVRPTARAEDIRRAYLALARRHHPDHGGDPAAMQSVNQAWTVLGDAARRRAWDAEHGVGRVWVAAPDATLDESATVEPGPDPDLFDDRPLTAPRRSLADLVPVALFAVAVAVGSVALALDEPAGLAVAGFLFFLSCIAVGAVALLTMRRSVRAGDR